MKMIKSEIYREIRNILLKEWDPIIVRDEPEAQDEYDAYILPIIRMLSEKASVQKLADFLVETETHMFGLAGNLARAEKTAAKLTELNKL